MVKGDARRALRDRAKLRAKYALLGVHNIVLFAMAGIDMAAWDALGQSLRPAAGAAARRRAAADPAYNSKGLGILPIERSGEGSGGAGRRRLPRGQAAARPARRVAEDLEALRAVKKAIGPGVTLMVDFNQGAHRRRRDRARPHDRRRRRRALDRGADRAPTISRDAADPAASRTPIQIGENFMGPEQMAQALAAGACDYVMPDARAHRRRHRLDARRGARAGRRDRDVEPPLPRGERHLLARHADLPLARVRGLGEPDPRSSRCTLKDGHRAFPNGPASASPGTRRPWTATRSDVRLGIFRIGRRASRGRSSCRAKRVYANLAASAAKHRERAAIDYYGGASAYARSEARSRRPRRVPAAATAACSAATGCCSTCRTARSSSSATTRSCAPTRWWCRSTR